MNGETGGNPLTMLYSGEKAIRKSGNIVIREAERVIAIPQCFLVLLSFVNLSKEGGGGNWNQ